MNHQTNKPGLIGAKSVVLGAEARFVGWADNLERVEEPEVGQVGTIIGLEREDGEILLEVTYRLPGKPARVFSHTLDEVSLVTLRSSGRKPNDPIRCFT